MGAGLERGNRRQGMPMVGRGDDHDVELVLGQHLAVVAIELDLSRLPCHRIREGGNARRQIGQHRAVDIAQGDDLDRGVSRSRFALPSGSRHCTIMNESV